MVGVAFPFLRSCGRWFAAASGMGLEGVLKSWVLVSTWLVHVHVSGEFQMTVSDRGCLLYEMDKLIVFIQNVYWNVKSQG